MLSMKKEYKKPKQKVHKDRKWKETEKDKLMSFFSDLMAFFKGRKKIEKERERRHKRLNI